MLKLKNIIKSFGGKVILDGISHEFQAGELWFLMGTNGSGKSTLFNIISGYLKQDSGDIFINGSSISKLNSYQRNNIGIYRSFQDNRIITNLTVLENVLLAFPELKGEKWWSSIFESKKLRNEERLIRIKANRILKDCFLDNLSSNKASDLSFGEQKLLTLACCIANDAKVVLLDEPIAGVNSQYFNPIKKIINILQKDKILVIVEHNISFISIMNQKILFLNNGSLLRFDNYKSMKENAIVQESYICAS